MVLYGCANLLDIEDPAGHVPDGSVVDSQPDAGPGTDATLDATHTDAMLDAPNTDAMLDAPLDTNVPSPPDSSDAAETGIDTLADAAPPPDFWSIIPPGAVAIFFADVTGDGKADLIGLGTSTVVVWPSWGPNGPGTSFVQNDVPWLDSPLEEDAVSFADVTGDGRADAIVALPDAVYVYPSLGTSFGPEVAWAPAAAEGTYPLLYGCSSTQFADVNGDGLANLLAINADGIVAALSTGTEFVDAGNWTANKSWWGDYWTAFAKIRGTPRADLIGVNHDGIHSLPSTGSLFDWGPDGGQENYNLLWTSAVFYANFFADVNGDGMADAIEVGNDEALVLDSNGAQFSLNGTANAPPVWAAVDLSQVATVAVADTTGDGCANLIVVNPGYVAVLESNCFNHFVRIGP